MKGRRVYADDRGILSLAEGDYGFDPIANHWSARPPGSHANSLEKWNITEHEDGTITASPSIRTFDFDNKEIWHGFLEHGEWKTV